MMNISSYIALLGRLFDTVVKLENLEVRRYLDLVFIRFRLDNPIYLTSMNKTVLLYLFSYHAFTWLFSLIQRRT